MNNQSVQDTNAKNLWKKVLGELQVEVSPLIFKTILSRASARDLTENSIEIICPDTHTKQMMSGKYLTLIQDSINKIGRGVFDIKFSVTEEKKAVKDPGPLFANDVVTGDEKSTASGHSYEDEARRSGLLTKFTFENYLMGANNQVAFAIANAVAEKPGTVYNPYFIYSGVGLGKTHLMQAIGNKILKVKPGMKVIYCTGESFTNELIENLQKGKRNNKYTSNEFRDKYRKADVLLIDDIQFIAGKEATQVEFFHTFDDLLRAQKQIVITSDRPPKDFTNIEDRIRSRFGSGIIADIQPPDLEMRIAILRKRRDENQDEIPNEIINFIAEKVSTNVRELEGAYLQVYAKLKAQGLEPTVSNAASILGETVRDDYQKPVNINQVIKAVCSYYSVKASDLKSNRRTKDLVIPRQIAMYLMKEITGTPLVTIGEFLGGRDHTTVMHGVRKVEAEIAELPKTRQDVSNVKQMISSM